MQKQVVKSEPVVVPQSFMFSGALAELLADYLERDIQVAHLDSRFQMYYRIRGLVPKSVRQFLQRRRNRGLVVASDWFMNELFFNCFRAAVERVVAAGTEEFLIHPWPDGKSHAVVLTHDVETSDGLKRVDRLAKLEEELGFRSTWYIIPHKYEVDMGLVKDLQQRGHEIGVHGYNHDGQLFTSRKVFEGRARFINEAASSYSAVGFRAPMVHRELNWMQSLDIEHDASCFDVDPFQAMPGGVGGVWPFRFGRFVELPYTLPQDHTLMALDTFDHRLWCRKHQAIEHARGQALLITHPDYLDSGAKLAEYQQFLSYLANVPSRWDALPSQVAKWYVERESSSIVNGAIAGPASDRGCPIRLRDLFHDFLNEASH